jgi:hypothetical protein
MPVVTIHAAGVGWFVAVVLGLGSGWAKPASLGAPVGVASAVPCRCNARAGRPKSAPTSARAKSRINNFFKLSPSFHGVKFIKPVLVQSTNFPGLPAPVTVLGRAFFVGFCGLIPAVLRRNNYVLRLRYIIHSQRHIVNELRYNVLQLIEFVLLSHYRKAG